MPTVAVYLNECVPSLPEVRVGDQAYGIAKLCLNGRWACDHESNELLLDGGDLIDRELVGAIYILLQKFGSD